MKHLLLLIALAASAQQIKINPITGLPDLVGSNSGAVSSVTAGPLGALVCTPTTGAVVCDADPLYVPNKTGSNTWTGVNDFTGATVTGIGGGTARTTYAALPACTLANSGTLYKLTDSIYEAQCNGTSYSYWTGQKYIPTLPWSNGTTFGAGATITATTGSVLFDSGAGTGGDSIRAAIKAVPAAPYTIILDVDVAINATVSSSCGLVLTDGTTAASNKVLTLMQSHIGLNSTKLNNATSWNSTYLNYVQSTSRGKISFRMVDDNVNRTWSVSPDRINWKQVMQQGRTDFLTATHYGYGCNMNGVSGDTVMVVEGLYAQ
jgi:hypothetical protein